MKAVDPPVVFQDEAILEVEKEVVGRHHACREEMPSQPIVRSLGFEKVCKAAMREDVNEKLSVIFEPMGDIPEKSVPVSHVLEHFNRDDTIKAAFGLEMVHVRRHHF